LKNFPPLDWGALAGIEVLFGSRQLVVIFLLSIREIGDSIFLYPITCRSDRLHHVNTILGGAAMSKSNKKNTKVKKSIIGLPIVLALLALGVLFTAGGFTFAATQEQHDSFCASCHTQPESTFYQRSTDAQPVDLASFHTTKDTRCIDCHSGPNISGRVSAELMGAHNALAWYSGTAVQPAKLTKPIADANCLKCHAELVQVTAGRETMNNHFHAFLARWQAVDRNAGTCVSCHESHTTDGDVQAFLNQVRTEAVCQACHNAIGEGE
jgi:predicted CXXCH cytochrome family protein